MYQSYKAAAAIGAKLVVNLTVGAAQVADGNTKFPVGISVDSVSAAGEGCAVAGCGEIAKLTFADTLAAGALVGSNASGQGIAFVAVTGTVYALGIALEAVAATGAVIPVLVHQMAVKTI